MEEKDWNKIVVKWSFHLTSGDVGKNYGGAGRKDQYFIIQG